MKKSERFHLPVHAEVVKEGVGPLGGYQLVVKFPRTGYGASIIRSSFSYGGDRGLYELAVLRDGLLCYSTPITSDVEGHLSVRKVEELIRKIGRLK